MQNIKPISALQNYDAVIDEVSYGHPVYLSENGHCKFVIVDSKEYDELKAIKELFISLENGEASANKAGYLTLEESKCKL